LKVQLTKQERMGESGHSLLRLLQNESLPLIDLFIREAIQNSLDATLPNQKETIIDVGVKEFSNEKLSKQLEGITDILVSRYGNVNPKAIYLSDKNTSGLTGAIRDDENHDIQQSKIYKLIYGISMNQTQSGAGGSWGLGKTSFFRLGNGIVIYYTRVKLQNGKYEERLAASLIEDSNKSDSLLKNNSRGIAWWGWKTDNDNYSDTYPITDQTEIHEILDIFNIEPYSEDETGTTVIIPYINEKRIESHDMKHEDNNEVNSNWWEQDLESRIEIAIQKWYGVRVFNKDYQKYYGSYLNVSLNGKGLYPSTFPTFFQKLRELYSYALRAKDEPNLGSETDNFNIKNIELNRMALEKDSNKIVGDLAYCTLDKEELRIVPPDNEPHPLKFLGYSRDEDIKELNSNIIAYTRKPAMIIDYDVNGTWSHNLPRLENKIVLGIFVPRSEQVLHEDFQNEIMYLDDYLRKSENADHASWQDVIVNNKKTTIVSRIRGNVSKVLNEEYGDRVEESKNSKASMLGRKLGNLILPSTKKGRTGKPAVEGGGSTGAGNARNRKIYFEILSTQIIEDSTMLVNANLSLNQGTASVIDIDINMGTRVYSYHQWVKDMNLNYPFEIIDTKIQTVNETTINKSLIDLDMDNLDVVQSAFSNPNRIEIVNKDDEKVDITLSIKVKVNDGTINPVFQVKEVSHND